MTSIGVRVRLSVMQQGRYSPLEKLTELAVPADLLICLYSFAFVCTCISKKLAEMQLSSLSTD